MCTEPFAFVFSRDRMTEMFSALKHFGCCSEGIVFVEVYAPFYHSRVSSRLLFQFLWLPKSSQNLSNLFIETWQANVSCPPERFTLSKHGA